VNAGEITREVHVFGVEGYGSGHKRDVIEAISLASCAFTAYFDHHAYRALLFLGCNPAKAPQQATAHMRVGSLERAGQVLQ